MSYINSNPKTYYLFFVQMPMGFLNVRKASIDFSLNYWH